MFCSDLYVAYNALQSLGALLELRRFGLGELGQDLTVHARLADYVDERETYAAYAVVAVKQRGYGHGGVDAAQYRAADVTYRNGDRIEGRALALDDARAGFAHIILDSGMVENGTCDVDRAGIFYLCWVPVPILFGLCLYFKKERKTYLRFALVFLFVNLIGFAGYYIHPAAPPWYAINYGFEPILNTPGNVAGLGRFDEIFGVTIFDSIYGRNANVFAAVPSLHAAYMVVALVYAIIGKCRWYVIALFSVIMAGIWGTAIYSCHHYIIDVLLGISCALLGWLLFEYGLMKIRGFRNFFDRYYQYIK